MKTFKQFIAEALSQIEIESNHRHRVNGNVMAGPDPAVQREIRHQAILNRTAKASQKPLLARMKSRIRRKS